MTDLDICHLKHIKECKECYKNFGVALTLCDATSNEGMALLAEERRKEKEDVSLMLEPLSVIKVVRQKINDIKSAVLEQIQNVNDLFAFEPAVAFATRGIEESSKSDQIKLEELDDEKTFILFDAQKDELYVQINMKNLGDKEIEIYLLDNDNKIYEVPSTREANFLKGHMTGVPVGDFKIYIDQKNS